MRNLKWIAVLIMCLSTLGASAQTSLKPLTGLGIGIHGDSGIKLLGAFEYGISDYSKVALETGFHWRDHGDDERDIDEDVDVLFPALTLLRIKPLWKSGFESFTSLGFDVNYRKYTINPTEQNVGNSISRDERSVGLDAGVGILKRLKTDSQWVFTPYLGLFYDVVWTTWDDTTEQESEAGSDDEDESDFSGNAAVHFGVEAEVSPSFSVRGGFAFSLTRTDTDFLLGINLHK